MKKKLRLENDELYYENGAFLGNVYREVDGYYVFWPKNQGGFWESHHMRLIADFLDELNKAWDDEVKSFFENYVEENNAQDDSF